MTRFLSLLFSTPTPGAGNGSHTGNMGADTVVNWFSSPLIWIILGIAVLWLLFDKKK